MISVGDIYDKDVNFLLGSGASYGLFPTLQLGVNDALGSRYTLEDLASLFERTSDPRQIPLFMHYYWSCIRPTQTFTLEAGRASATGKTVVDNYRTFLETVLGMLQRRKSLERRCNLFTTNYDGCLPLVADEILQDGSIDFVLNDGTRGFRKKFLQARNFNGFLCQTGIFDQHRSSIPQINLIHLHGSVYWRKEDQKIVVAYENEDASLLSKTMIGKLEPFSNDLLDQTKKLIDVVAPTFSGKEKSTFWAEYEKIPIVNPTKWKFHETVYEEHYYQMLRLLSYELEKPNAVLITFGFSFADEHILHLVKRSLSNPHLQVFVCCFDEAAHTSLSAMFKSDRNVQCLMLNDGVMDFSAFNREVFAFKETPVKAEVPPAEVAAE